MERSENAGGAPQNAGEERSDFAQLRTILHMREAGAKLTTKRRQCCSHQQISLEVWLLILQFLPLPTLVHRVRLMCVAATNFFGCEELLWFGLCRSLQLEANQKLFLSGLTRDITTLGSSAVARTYKLPCKLILKHLCQGLCRWNTVQKSSPQLDPGNFCELIIKGLRRGDYLTEAYPTGPWLTVSSPYVHSWPDDRGFVGQRLSLFPTIQCARSMDPCGLSAACRLSLKVAGRWGIFMRSRWGGSDVGRNWAVTLAVSTAATESYDERCVSPAVFPNKLRLPDGMKWRVVTTKTFDKVNDFQQPNKIDFKAQNSPRPRAAGEKGAAFFTDILIGVLDLERSGCVKEAVPGPRTDFMAPAIDFDLLKREANILAVVSTEDSRVVGLEVDFFYFWPCEFTN